jgi:hypothetical protein
VKQEVAASQLVLAGGVNNPLWPTLSSVETKTPQKPYLVASFNKERSIMGEKCLVAKSFREELNADKTREIVMEVCKDPHYASSPSCHNTGEFKAMGARQFETRYLLYFGIDLPPVIENLFASCNSPEEQTRKDCQRALAKTVALAAERVLSHPAKVLTMEHGHVAVTAVGDALASPHFFSGEWAERCKKSGRRSQR